VRCRRANAPLTDLQRALHASQDADRWQLYGELILAFGHNLPAGATTLHAPDYTQPDAPEVAIPIDPSKTPAENAERYFHKARRARESRAELHARLQRLTDEANELRYALLQAEQAADPDALQQTARAGESARLATRDRRTHQPRQTRRERPVRRAQNPRAP
jgi:predicted ribosome quality control (RQC) complex YloA/Tae2 family protein